MNVMCEAEWGQILHTRMYLGTCTFAVSKSKSKLYPYLDIFGKFISDGYSLICIVFALTIKPTLTLVQFSKK